MLDNTQQLLVALGVSLGMMAVIIELVRRRKLREEYAWLWLLAGAAMLAVGIRYDLLLFITALIGAGDTSSTLFFFGLIFVIALCLQFSVKISKLETHVKNLTQELALLEAERAPEPRDVPPRS